MQQGILIAFEGIDGTGKSTQLHLLAGKLNGLGYEVVATREPTDGQYGRKIRELFQNRHTISRQEELELFVKDRQEHVDEVITPALLAGKIVLTDRYYLSTVAYQGAAGLDPEMIMANNEAFAPKPDLAIVLVAPPSVGVHRIKTLRQEKLNDFEQEAGLAKVSAVFDGLQRHYITRIDGTMAVEQVHAAVWQRVKELLKDMDNQA